jgi:hypothetical protein
MMATRQEAGVVGGPHKQHLLPQHSSSKPAGGQAKLYEQHHSTKQLRHRRPLPGTTIHRRHRRHHQQKQVQQLVVAGG